MKSKYMWVLVCFFASFSVFGTVAAKSLPDCPEDIQYLGGRILKKGDTFYYNNGEYLIRNGTVYYPGHRYLKRDDVYYYLGGSYLSKSDNLYYPNGSYLKRAENYYYANGTYLKKGEYFYYENASYARKNGKLYRPDGSLTAFPLSLEQSISEWGELRARVFTDKEEITINFAPLELFPGLVTARLLWNHVQISGLELRVSTGIDNETVWVSINAAGTTCKLGVPGSPVPGAQFKISHPVADIFVSVKNGLDPIRVEEELIKTLDVLSATP